MFAGTPPAGTSATFSNIVISVTDGSSSAELPAFAITVTTPPNRAPTISGIPSTSALQGTQYTFEATAADLDADPLMFSITNPPSWATFTQTGPATAVLQGTPSGIHVGAHSNIVISVSDGTTSTPLPAFAITVTSSNTPPAISGTPSTLVQVGSLFSFTASASDADANTTLRFSIANPPSWATFTQTGPTTAVLQGTPAATDAGIHANIVIRVSDGQDSVALPAFAITVNRHPVISGIPPTTATVGSFYSFAPTASDADGDPLTFGAVNVPAWATLSASGVLSGTPEPRRRNLQHRDRRHRPQIGSGAAARVRDHGHATEPPPAIWARRRPPWPPERSTRSRRRRAMRILQPTFSADNKPAWATLDGAKGKLSGTPVTTATGTYPTIVIGVSDGHVTTLLAPFSITVTNATPSIDGAPEGTATVGTLYSFTPTASDANAGTTLTFSIDHRPAWATFDTGTGRLQGTPSLANVGTFSDIVIGVSDGVASAWLPAFSIQVVTAPITARISGVPMTATGA